MASAFSIPLLVAFILEEMDESTLSTTQTALRNAMVLLRARQEVEASLNESTELLHTMMQPGDVVLYENDLPDNYSE